MAGFKPLVLALVVVFMTMDHASSSHPTIKAAYWPSWNSDFTPSSIDTSLFTHVYFAFLMPDNTTYDLKVSESEHALLSDFNSILHNKNPPVKTLLSFGGGGSDSTIFARLVADSYSTMHFIESSIMVARKYGFDGLDLDWEFPANPKEMQDLGVFFKKWRMAVDKEAKATCRPPLLLTAAVYFSIEVMVDPVQRSYPPGSIKNNLDFINVMCFDYKGAWDTSATGAHAGLFDPHSKFSTSYGIMSWIKAGLPTEKLVLGLPLYGRSWTLESHKAHGVGAPAVDVGPGDKGFLTYTEVVEFNKMHGATEMYDAETVSMYSYAGTTWISYDDQMSVTMKIGFARAHGLGGYFFWAVNGDKDWKISRQALFAWGS